MMTESESGSRVAELPFVLYGAGNAGRSAAKHLLKRGVRIEAFIDQRAERDEPRDGINVFTLEYWLQRPGATEFNVLVTIFNPRDDVVPIIKRLREAGFLRVWTMVDYVNMCPEDSLDRLWLAPSSHYLDKDPQLRTARALLADDCSRRWFDGAMCLRNAGDYRDLPSHSPADQYVPRDLQRWPTPLRIIDCGAFDGDTIRTLRNEGYHLEAVVALEPDPENYKKLVESHKDIDGVFLPCGVSSKAQQFRFESGVGPSCRIGDEGALTIQCISVDEAMPSFAPNLIKMDIEGAEMSALQGAEHTIRRYRPSLAVAIYHKPDDIWEIPLWLANLGLDYKMAIRGHGPNGFDLILYCRVD